MLKSTENWSGRQVDGVMLGEPAIADDGQYVWDGGVPEGVINLDGQVVTKDDKGFDVVDPKLALTDVKEPKLADVTVFTKIEKDLKVIEDAKVPK